MRAASLSNSSLALLSTTFVFRVLIATVRATGPTLRPDSVALYTCSSNGGGGGVVGGGRGGGGSGGGGGGDDDDDER